MIRPRVIGFVEDPNSILVLIKLELNQLSTTMACVYSSRTNTWVPMATMAGRMAFDLKQPAVLNDAVYWLIKGRTKIPEFELDANSLLLIRTPIDLPDFLVLPMDDGWLGYAGMMGLIVKVFPIEDIYEDGYATWLRSYGSPT
uniref:F-box associated domain-containing protein n=1 Tax=Oryza punctata TaxID=4537 RepID=A0A0E0M5C6_ORYPU